MTKCNVKFAKFAILSLPPLVNDFITNMVPIEKASLACDMPLVIWHLTVLLLRICTPTLLPLVQFVKVSVAHDAI